MCDVKKYEKLYQEIEKLQPEDTLQLVLEAETEEQKEFYEMVGDFLLQKKQREIIERKLFQYIEGGIALSEGIVYQNKDVEFKMISETFKEKSFAAYGLDLPKIKEVLPTNLPVVFANEMRIDNVFLLEDDSVAIVDCYSAN